MKLEKKLKLLDVFCFCSGSMISSGLFILPALAFSLTGPASLISYLIASIMMIPAMLAKAEMSTAMPKSGGTSFFVSRGLGPFFGTFSGIMNWFSIALKSAFALIGIGMLVTPIFPGVTDFQIKMIAVGSVVFFTTLNIVGVEESSKAQIVFVVVLLVLLVVFNAISLPKIDTANFTGFMDKRDTIFSTAGLVFISYGGLTKVCSVGEEVKNPGKVLPKGMIISFITVSLLYLLTIVSVIGLINPDNLITSALPISDAAYITTGNSGFLLMTLAAALAFFTTANAGIMSASRTPLSMSKDKYLPEYFGKVNKKTKTPITSILITSSFMILVILGLNLNQLVSSASAMMLVLFSLNCITIIVLKYSKLNSYRPLYKCPLVPILPIIGLVCYLTMLFLMDVIVLLIVFGFFIISFILYYFYGRKRSEKDSALVRLVHNIAGKELQNPILDVELRDIIYDRDEIIEDRFDKVIKKSLIKDIDEEITVDELFKLIAIDCKQVLDIDSAYILSELKKKENEYSSAIAEAVAIPHLELDHNEKFSIFVYRSKKGINFSNHTVKTVFFLLGNKNERNFHLKCLVAIVQIVANPPFLQRWLNAKNEDELRNTIALGNRIRDINT